MYMHMCLFAYAITRTILEPGVAKLLYTITRAQIRITNIFYNIYIRKQLCISTYIRMYTYTYTYMNMYMYIHIHVYIYIHISVYVGIDY